jgi:sulfur carrier protein
MRIEVNGEPVKLPATASIADVVAEAGADPERRGMAVAVDGEVVPRSAWDETALREGAKVEVVSAVQGG